MATGVLPVCIGKATRIIEYYDMDRKTYHAGMKLGYTSDTLDIWGNVIRTENMPVFDEEAIRKAFAEYTGIIRQIPPKYSALKINGRRAYDLARAGEDFEIRAREITIFDNEVTRIDTDSGEIEFNVICSKGTYIRALARDIGERLQSGAHLIALRRTRVGDIRVENCMTVENFLEQLNKYELKNRLNEEK
jgi:tRNA pseudouridine55 synthase